MTCPGKPSTPSFARLQIGKPRRSHPAGFRLSRAEPGGLVTPSYSANPPHGNSFGFDSAPWLKTSPLAVPVKKPKATWVRPIVDAEIEYGALTDGLLREAVFKGLRDDLALPAAHAPPVASDRWQRNHKGRGAVPRENILQLLPDAVPPSKE